MGGLRNDNLVQLLNFVNDHDYDSDGLLLIEKFDN